jgi:two-component system KDP operon response regulator KdpE
MATAAPVVLVVEDGPQMRRFLRTSLSAHGYRVIEAGTAREALILARGHRPDLILLDLGLPDGDGLTVARTLRSERKIPIIVLSARGREQDKVTALDLGADDYLTKPFGIGELLARIRVAQRHAAPQAIQGEPLRLGALEIDLEGRQVRRNGTDIHLTPTEWRLLTALAAHAGLVVTHRQLLESVWGPELADQTQYLRVFMAQLRQKLEPDPSRPQWLITEPAVGYRLRT